MPVALSPSQWRVLNAVSQKERGSLYAAPLAEAQAADVADVVKLDEAKLVTCHVGTAQLSLAEHLAHDGSAMVVGLRLTEKGERYLEAPCNKVLQSFADNPHGSLTLGYVHDLAGVDWSVVEPLVHRKLIKCSSMLLGGAPIEALDVPLHAIDAVRLALTARGRHFLPLD